MNALSAPTPATSRRSLFPERITAGRARTAAALRRHADCVGAVETLVRTVEAVDASIAPDAPPFASQARHLARLARDVEARMRLARALHALARLHDACAVPAPLFAVASARHVSVLLSPDPVATESLVPLGPVLAWTRTTGTRRAAAVREMADLLGRLGVHRLFPLPAAVARSLPRRPLSPDAPQTARLPTTGQPPDRPPAPGTYSAWTDAVDAAASALGLHGAVAHLTALPWHDAFDAGLAPDAAARAVVAWIVAVRDPQPFAWTPASVVRTAA